MRTTWSTWCGRRHLPRRQQNLSQAHKKISSKTRQKCPRKLRLKKVKLSRSHLQSPVTRIASEIWLRHVPLRRRSHIKRRWNCKDKHESSKYLMIYRSLNGSIRVFSALKSSDVSVIIWQIVFGNRQFLIFSFVRHRKKIQLSQKSV